MGYLKYFYLLMSIYNIPFNAIFASENFEDEVKLKKFFKNDDGHIKRNSVVIFRIMFVVFCYLISFLSSDVSKILDLGGSISTPFLSYFFPVRNLSF